MRRGFQGHAGSSSYMALLMAPCLLLVLSMEGGLVVRRCGHARMES